MKPLTELTIGHVGKTIHVTDQDIDVTGTLYRIEAERELIHEGTWADPSRTYPGPWYELDLTIAGSRICVTQTARWEPAERAPQ